MLAVLVSAHQRNLISADTIIFDLQSLVWPSVRISFQRVVHAAGY